MLLILSFISIIFSIYIGVTQHFVNKSVAFILFIPLITLIIMIYMFKTVKKTQKGINEYSKWKAFKNFLKDFGSLDSKDLPDIVLWEKYLVYATTLGVAKKLSKVMKIKAEELNISDSMQELPDISNIYYMNRIITRSVRSSINSANQAYRVANSSSSGSSWSSGSGSGGGFSSGGGSFGGGGGGGRF